MSTAQVRRKLRIGVVSQAAEIDDAPHAGLLGGVGEIGMNLALYGYGPAKNREWIIVDCGVSFAGPELPGVDLILPDIRFIEANKAAIKAMIITHAHEDHYGAVMDLWPKIKCPLWVSPFTAGLLEAKHKSDGEGPEMPVTLFRGGETFQCGKFSVEAIPVTHSIPEPFSLAITTPLGTVIHTGDWKIDPTPAIGPLTAEARFRELGDKGVLALMCDSTNAMRDGISPSEADVAATLNQGHVRELLAHHRGAAVRGRVVDNDNLKGDAPRVRFD